MKLPRGASLVLATVCLLGGSAFAQEQGSSTCYGTPEVGKLENGIPLPESGPNFTAYSALGIELGRTYLHSQARDAVVRAFARLNEKLPSTVFMYGETGFPKGGKFKPHKTHQNGLSADLMVPVIDTTSGKSVPLPASAANKYGYGIEFDSKGKFGKYAIDFEAVAYHLHFLAAEAKELGIGIRRVIFDPKFVEILGKTEAWKQLKPEIHFWPHTPWVRHDEHYHVDFKVPCKPL